MENQTIPTGTAGQKFLGIISAVLILSSFRVLGEAIGVGIVSLITHLSPESLSSKLLNPNPGDKNLFLLLQGINQVIMFFILPLTYIYFFRKNLFTDIRFSTGRYFQFAILAVLILLVSFPIVAWMEEWNKALPVSASAKNMEEKLAKLTNVIAYSPDPLDFLFSTLIIAILPAIGEEYLFRGLIQTDLMLTTRNPHLAIWITGFLFSFFHLQFLGFFPRMFLGVTFGYLYYWSGSLLIPITIHFLNNFLQLILLNLYMQKVIDVDINESPHISGYFVAFSVIVFIYLLFTFKKIQIPIQEQIS